MISFFQSVLKFAFSQAEGTNNRQEANVTANMNHQEADSVSEEATTSCEKEDDVDKR